jgi:chromosome segregation ATPase
VLNFKEPVTLLRGLLKDRFATTVEEDAVKFNILRDTVNRENTATADVQALNREYNNEVESRKVEVQKREIMIRKLKEEIEALRSTSESERKSFEQLSEEHRLNDEERFKSEEIGLHQKVKDAEVELHNTSTKCVVDEKSLRATRSKKEAALQKMLEDYDAEMISASETMKQLEIETVRDREILDGVEKALAQLRREEDDYELELEAGKMRQTHRAVIEGEIHQQARIIQAYFRSYIVRVHESQKGKKKKGGKKK